MNPFTTKPATEKETEGHAARAPAPLRRRDDEPSDLPARRWRGAARGSFTRFREVGITNWAAALTYFAVLALFPAMIALVSVLGLIGSSAIDPLLENLTSVAPGPAKDLLVQSLQGIEANPGASGVVFVIGLALALWSASGYVSGFMDASNDIYGVDESRPLWKKLPLRYAVTTVCLTLVALCACAVVLTGDLAQRAGDLIGVGQTAVDVWDIAKWPVMLAIVSLVLAILYWTAPNVDQPGFKWITPGSVLAIVLAAVASAGFALYVANFGSYNQTYGTLGGAVVFLVWLWIVNIAVLLGATFNAELNRERVRGRSRQSALSRETTSAQSP